MSKRKARVNTMVTYVVSECSEYHEMGELHEGLRSLEEAKAAFQKIDPTKRNGIPAIGIRIHNEGEPEYMDVQADFFFGDRIDLETLEFYPEFLRYPEALDAVCRLVEAFPEAEIIGKMP